MKEAKDILDTLYRLQQQVARFTTALPPVPMTLNEYQAEMQRTYKPNRKANHALGVMGELGETVNENTIIEEKDIQAMRTGAGICDVVKKDEFHGREVNRPAILKELGDVLWYVSALATDYGFTLEDVARVNVAKLKERYPDGFVKGGGNRDIGQIAKGIPTEDYIFESRKVQQ
jgi:NTP pyrophosphatase (non-canonical NTP hydrolase)